MNRDLINRLAVALLKTLDEGGLTGPTWIPEGHAYAAAGEKLGLGVNDFNAAIKLLEMGAVLEVSNHVIRPGRRFGELKAVMLAHEARS